MNEKIIKKNSLISGIRCCVQDCRKSKRNCKNLKLFKFPSVHSPMGKLWRELCNISSSKYCTNLFICDRHFSSSDIGKKKLRVAAVPKLFINPVKAEKPTDVIVPEVNVLDQQAVNTFEENSINISNSSVDDTKPFPAISYTETNSTSADAHNEKSIFPAQFCSLAELPNHANTSEVPAEARHNSNNEFLAFGNSVGMQLQNMPFELALQLELDIQTLITKSRLKYLQNI